MRRKVYCLFLLLFLWGLRLRLFLRLFLEE